MNYKKIYDDFIADRLGKQPKDGSYYEVHHIKPRCMGGDDLPSNLIRLTAGDHLFAHQILARAYDKTEYAHNLWGAVIVLCRDTLHGERRGKGGKRLGSLAVKGAAGIRLRKIMDSARARGVRARSGENHGSHDPTFYHFRNTDGTDFVGTRISFCKKFGVHPGKIPRLLEEEINRTSDGWYVYDHQKTDEQRKLENDPAKYVFYAECSGATKKATRATFKKYTSMPWREVHAIVDNGMEYGSWRLNES